MISCGADKSIYFRTAHKVRHVSVNHKLVNTVFVVEPACNETGSFLISSLFDNTCQRVLTIAMLLPGSLVYNRYRILSPVLLFNILGQKNIFC